MSTPTRTLRIAAAGALMALAVAAPPAGAATVKLSGGSTTLKLDPGTATALGEGLGVSVSPIASAKAGTKGVSFPITGGTIDPATAAGTVTDSGGLQLRAGATKVRLTSFTIGVDRTPPFGQGGQGAAARVLALARGAKVSRAGLGTNVSGVAVKLSAKGAAALNEAFGVKAFKRGLRVGTPRSRRRPRRSPSPVGRPRSRWTPAPLRR